MNVPVSSKTQWYGTVSCPPNSVLSVFTFNDYFEFAGECTSFETIVSPNNPYFPVGAWTFPQAGNGQKGNSFQFASFAFWAHAVIQALGCWFVVCFLSFSARNSQNVVRFRLPTAITGLLPGRSCQRQSPRTLEPAPCARHWAAVRPRCPCRILSPPPFRRTRAPARAWMRCR